MTLILVSELAKRFITVMARSLRTLVKPDYKKLAGLVDDIMMEPEIDEDYWKVDRIVTKRKKVNIVAIAI